MGIFQKRKLSLDLFQKVRYDAFLLLCLIRGFRLLARAQMFCQIHAHSAQSCFVAAVFCACTPPAGWRIRASPTGVIGLPSAPQASRSRCPFMAFTTTQKCGQTQRYGGPEGMGGDDLWGHHLLPHPSLEILSLVGQNQEFDLCLSWSCCSLRRCTTLSGLHQILRDTATHSYLSQEEPGEGSCVGHGMWGRGVSRLWAYTQSLWFLKLLYSIFRDGVVCGCLWERNLMWAHQCTKERWRFRAHQGDVGPLPFPRSDRFHCQRVFRTSACSGVFLTSGVWLCEPEILL